jgi:pyruvate-formate lyase-activating enzyme
LHTVPDGDDNSMRYGFYGRLTRDFPSQVIVDFTERCNLACVHCPHEQFKKSPHYAGRLLPPELNVKIVDEVRGRQGGDVQYIRYASEGEPLLHPDCYQMIEYAVKNSGVYVTLTTNGTIMNEARTQSLLESGIHMIDVSIDAYSPETYAQVRKGGDLEKTRGNVLRLLKWIRQAGAKTKVVVSFIEHEANRHEAALFEAYWKDRGAHYVVVRRLHSAAGAIEKIAREMAVRTPGQPRYPCVYPWERVVLNPRGFLAFCPADWTAGASVADYRTATVQETWTGRVYELLRRAHLTNDFSAHPFCGNCPDWRQIRWPEEGRAYADMIKDFSRGDAP